METYVSIIVINFSLFGRLFQSFLNTNYNILEWFEIVKDRKNLYKQILDSDILDEGFLKESLKNYTDDKREWSNYLVDIDEELIKALIKQKGQLLEHKEEGDEKKEQDSTYVFLASKVTEYKNKAKQIFLQREIGKTQADDFSYTNN